MSKKILILEDDQRFLKILQKLLAKDFDIQCVTTLKDAYKLASETIFDVVLSDWWLPDGNGKDFMQHLVDNKYPAKLILMSASHIEEVKKVQNPPWQIFLPKPIELAQLLKEIK